MLTCGRVQSLLRLQLRLRGCAYMDWHLPASREKARLLSPADFACLPIADDNNFVICKGPGQYWWLCVVSSAPPLRSASFVILVVVILG